MQGASAALNSSPLLRSSGSLNIGGNGGAGGGASGNGGSPDLPADGHGDVGAAAPSMQLEDAQAQQQTSAPAAAAQPTTWEAWLKHFEAMDDLADNVAHLQVRAAAVWPPPPRTGMVHVMSMNSCVRQ